MLKQIIENPIPFKPYFVESNDTGAREVCTLTRNVWNKINGAFFTYASRAVAVSEAHECECGEWCMYPMKYGTQDDYDVYCENCINNEVTQ